MKDSRRVDEEAVICAYCLKIIHNVFYDEVVVRCPHCNHVSGIKDSNSHD